MEGSRTPLEGIRVVELATFVAGPFCCMTLAQLGAEVIRVDAIGGGPDLGRWPLAPDGGSLYWTGLNRGTRSIAVDLGTDAGREIVYSLLGAAGSTDDGILVTNAYGRRWLEYPAISARRSDVIQAHVRGAADGSPAVDYTINAEVGLPHVTGPDTNPGPTNHVLPAWDLLTGLHAALAVVTAVRHRERTGDGQLIEVSLEDTAFAATAALGLLPEPLITGHERGPSGNFLYGAFGADFETGDGRRVMVIALTSRQWRDLREMTGSGSVLEALEEHLGVRFSEEGARFEHREVIQALLSPWFQARSAEEVEEAFAGTAVLIGRYRTFAEAARRGLESGVLHDVQQPGIGPVPLGKQPLRFSGLTTRNDDPAPILGSDTGTVLQEVLALSNSEVARLRAEGTVA